MAILPDISVINILVSDPNNVINAAESWNGSTSGKSENILSKSTKLAPMQY